MKPYSLDLREKLVGRYEAGGISQRELAKQFGVSLFLSRSRIARLNSLTEMLILLTLMQTER